MKMKKPVNDAEGPHLDSQAGDKDDRHDGMQDHELWNITSQRGYSFQTPSTLLPNKEKKDWNRVW